jgi:hypothetical protein
MTDEKIGGADDRTEQEDDLFRIRIYVREEDVDLVQDVAKFLRMDGVLAEELREAIREAVTGKQRFH